MPIEIISELAERYVTRFTSPEDAILKKINEETVKNHPQAHMLSGPVQGQLLSFIRALLYNPSILILDEATSSIDTESELLIEKAIDKLIAGRTSIVIAHRLSTIQRASKIIVLDKGEVKEIGTHLQLLAKGGFYSKLHQMQFDKRTTLV